MYNKTDGAGWCFTAYCNLTCNVEKLVRPCHSTTPPTPTTTTTTTSYSTTTKTGSTKTSTVSISSTKSVKDCSNLKPPRKVFEFSSINIYMCFKGADHPMIQSVKARCLSLILFDLVSKVSILRKSETRSLIPLNKEKKLLKPSLLYIDLFKIYVKMSTVKCNNTR